MLVYIRYMWNPFSREVDQNQFWQFNFFCNPESSIILTWKFLQYFFIILQEQHTILKISINLIGVMFFNFNFLRSIVSQWEHYFKWEKIRKSTQKPT